MWCLDGTVPCASWSLSASLFASTNSTLEMSSAPPSRSPVIDRESTLGDMQLICLIDTSGSMESDDTVHPFARL